jgi:hypothetical protein
VFLIPFLRDSEADASKLAHIGQKTRADILINHRTMPTATTSAAQSRASMTSVAWIAEDGLELAEWSRAGQRLAVMNRSSPWWVGDWIRYGNEKFGEKYSRATSITGYDRQTLMNMVYVASNFEISRRRESLSWSHHESLAALSVGEQERWLDHAAEHKMSVADLRLELRSRQRKNNDDLAPANGDSLDQQRADVMCPNCAQPIPRSLLETQLRAIRLSGREVSDTRSRKAR